MAYLNYLARWNEAHNPYTIHYINPFDWHWNAADELVDMEKNIDAKEQDQSILSVIAGTSIFIHEHFGNYGMFNTSRHAETFAC